MSNSNKIKSIVYQGYGLAKTISNWGMQYSSALVCADDTAGCQCGSMKDRKGIYSWTKGDQSQKPDVCQEAKCFLFL